VRHPAITTGKLPIAATIVLWSARTPTVAILGFWGFLIAAHLLGTAGAPSCPLTPTDYMSLVAMVASLLGLGLALKWPRPESAITLAAFAVGAFANLASFNVSDDSYSDYRRVVLAVFVPRKHVAAA
jgi:hypothetical protein